jgi:hypothetical protein
MDTIFHSKNCPLCGELFASIPMKWDQLFKMISVDSKEMKSKLMNRSNKISITVTPTLLIRKTRPDGTVFLEKYEGEAVIRKISSAFPRRPPLTKKVAPVARSRDKERDARRESKVSKEEVQEEPYREPPVSDDSQDKKRKGRSSLKISPVATLITEEEDEVSLGEEVISRDEAIKGKGTRGDVIPLKSGDGRVKEKGRKSVQQIAAEMRMSRDELDTPPRPTD